MELDRHLLVTLNRERGHLGQQNDDFRYFSRTDDGFKRSERHVHACYDRRTEIRHMLSDEIERRPERERSYSYNRHNPRGERYEGGDVELGSHDQGRMRNNTGMSSRRTLRSDDRMYGTRQYKYRNAEWERHCKRGKRHGISTERVNGRDSDYDKDLLIRRKKTIRSRSYSDQEDGCRSRDQYTTILKDCEMQSKFEDEEAVDDYEKRVALKLAEQEENDNEDIMAKSRHIRQVITEKYQKQQQPQMAKQMIAIPNPHTGDDKPKDFQSFFKADGEVLGGFMPLRLEASENMPCTIRLQFCFPNSEKPTNTDFFEDDIFGGTPIVRKPGEDDGLPAEKSGLQDEWDDAEGYYSFRFGEVLDGRFEITALHGKGVFSSVVRAKDLMSAKDNPSEVAIKMIRNNETMYKAGCAELIILKKLGDADLKNRQHCVRLISNFKHQNHLCLVFESLHMNLREVLKKFGRNIGLKLTAVRLYAKHLFIALKHLRNCGVLHCDIKPDNILVNEAKNVLKLCDFGNAMLAGKNAITPYLVSRFYRAPEIILGLTYDYPIDMWSVGCCLYELYTGKVLFCGATNNEMLRLHMELKGFFPRKMLRKGAFTHQHFDQDFNFCAEEDDPVTKKRVKRLLNNIKPKGMGSLMASSPGEDYKMVSNFKDLLERMFLLDPDKRLTVSQALSHKFITEK